jgi:hypothetical protein
VIRPDVELRVFVCVTKLLSEAPMAEAVEMIVEPRESVEGMRTLPVRSEPELLTIPVAIADPLKVIPSSVALAIEEFAHPFRPIVVVEGSCGTKVDSASALEVVVNWTSELSTNPKGMSEIVGFGADADELAG